MISLLITLISLLITLLFIVLVFAITLAIIRALGVPLPNIIYAIMLFMLLTWLVDRYGGFLR